jgi:hypothetical protein
MLGEPDLGLLTPPEMASKVSQISAAVPRLTILADADTGEWEDSFMQDYVWIANFSCLNRWR